jgi:hypothetical protein
VHAPLTHVLLLAVHEVPTVQVPVELHVCGWFDPEQFVCPGAQTPAHAPLTQVSLLLVQDVPTTQLPEALHVWTSFDPSQPTEPATQFPTQEPPTHVEFVHAFPEFCHIPPTHVCGCCPLQFLWPGAHDPEHAPLTHVEFEHVTELPQVPADVHV